MIVSYWRNENKGTRRMYYSITPKGKDCYEIQKHDWKKTKELIDSLIYY